MLVVTHFIEILTHITCCLKNTGLNNKENIPFHLTGNLEIERFLAWLLQCISHVLEDMGIFCLSNLSLSAAHLIMLPPLLVKSIYLCLLWARLCFKCFMYITA